MAPETLSMASVPTADTPWNGTAAQTPIQRAEAASVPQVCAMMTEPAAKNFVMTPCTSSGSQRWHSGGSPKHAAFLDLAQATFGEPFVEAGT